MVVVSLSSRVRMRAWNILLLLYPQDWGPNHARGWGAQCAHLPGGLGLSLRAPPRAPPSVPLAPTTALRGGDQQPGPGNSQITWELGLLQPTPQPPSTSQLYCRFSSCFSYWTESSEDRVGGGGSPRVPCTAPNTQ